MCVVFTSLDQMRCILLRQCGRETILQEWGIVNQHPVEYTKSEAHPDHDAHTLAVRHLSSQSRIGVQYRVLVIVAN